MRINTNNLNIPGQSQYDFCDGQLHNDPVALTNFLAGQSRNVSHGKVNCYTRSYEKAQRLQRMAERDRKDRSRRADY